MKHYMVLIIIAGLILPHAAHTFNPDQEMTEHSVRIQSEDGSYYIGQVKDGLKHGHGRYVSADGAEYQGGFISGEPHGWGIYHYPDGRSKKVLYKSGILVESRFISHDRGEPGCIYGEFVSLGRYSGWFRGGMVKGYVPHGRGIMRYFNGSIFSGQWIDGKMHGNGSVQWEDGSKYTGQWIRGKRTGNGTYTWANGDTYIGEWKDNQMCGKGIYYFSNGKVKKGIWNEKKVFAGK